MNLLQQIQALETIGRRRVDQMKESKPAINKTNKTFQACVSKATGI